MYYNERPRSRMDDDIFRKAISDLKLINYTGSISFGLYGEPTLDGNLSNKIKVARSYLPRSYLIVYSNGDFLTPEKYFELINFGLNEVYITNHNTDGTISESLKSLLASLNTEKKYKKYLSFNPALKEFYTRGGAIEIPGYGRRAKLDCCDSTYNLTIQSNGDVILCHNDYFSKHVFGNILQNTLVDIWKNPEFSLVRQSNRRKNYLLDICRICMHDQ